MIEDNGKGAGAYDYVYHPPISPDAKLDKPRLLVSRKALEMIGVDYVAATEGRVLGVEHAPTMHNFLGRKSDLEFRVSKRIFELVKNTPSWFASEDELKAMNVNIEAARAGMVRGIRYNPIRKDTRIYQISTVLYKQLDKLVESLFW